MGLREGRAVSCDSEPGADCDYYSRLHLLSGVAVERLGGRACGAGVHRQPGQRARHRPLHEHGISTLGGADGADGPARGSGHDLAARVDSARLKKKRRTLGLHLFNPDLRVQLELDELGFKVIPKIMEAAMQLEEKDKKKKGQEHANKNPAKKVKKAEMRVRPGGQETKG